MYYAMGMWDAIGSNKSEETDDSNSEEIWWKTWSFKHAFLL